MRLLKYLAPLILSACVVVPAMIEGLCDSRRNRPRQRRPRSRQL